MGTILWCYSGWRLWLRFLEFGVLALAVAVFWPFPLIGWAAIFVLSVVFHIVGWIEGVAASIGDPP